MQTGTVKFYNATKGFGFITKDNGSDIFFHVSEIRSNQDPQDGDKVQFNESEGKKGPIATEVSVIH